MNEHVLVMLPHPDDESYGVAGLIAQSRKRGIQSRMHAGHLGNGQVWAAHHMPTVRHFLNYENRN